jgi:hypothetical protein
MSVVIFAAAVALAAVGSEGWAQSKPPPSAEQRALAKELFELTGQEQSTTQAIRQLSRTGIPQGGAATGEIFRRHIPEMLDVY